MKTNSIFPIHRQTQMIIALVLVSFQSVQARPLNVFNPAKLITCRGSITPSDLSSYNIPKELNSIIYLMVENFTDEINSGGDNLTSSLAAYLHGSLALDITDIASHFSVSTKVNSDLDRKQFYDINRMQSSNPVTGSNLLVEQIFLSIQTGKGANINRGTGYLKLGAGTLGSSQSYRVFYQLSCKLA